MLTLVAYTNEVPKSWSYVTWMCGGGNDKTEHDNSRVLNWQEYNPAEIARWVAESRKDGYCSPITMRLVWGETNSLMIPVAEAWNTAPAELSAAYSFSSRIVKEVPAFLEAFLKYGVGGHNSRTEANTCQTCGQKVAADSCK